MLRNDRSGKLRRLVLPGVILWLFMALSVKAQTATWAKSWDGNRYSDVTGSYLRPDPENGAPWICLSHISATGGAVYKVPRPTFIHRSIRITVGVYGYDDGTRTGAVAGLYNNSTNTPVVMATMGKTAAWYSGSITTDLYIIAGSTDSIRVFVAADGANHAHIQTVRLSVEYTASPPDLSPTSFTLSGIQRATPGENLAGRLTAIIKNRGGTASGPFKVGIYISKLWASYPSDRLLTNGKGEVNNLGPGEIIGAPISASIQLPSDLAPGNYYLVLVTDCDGTVAEGDETNNVMVTPLIVGYGCGELLLRADFNEDSPGGSPNPTLPGEPVGDSVSYRTAGSAGTVSVQDTLVSLPHRALVARLPDGSSQSWTSFVTAAHQYFPQVKVRLHYLTSFIYGSGTSISLRDAGDVDIAQYFVSAYSGPIVVNYYGGHGAIPLSVLAGGYLEFTIDFAEKTTSLAVNGTPLTEAQRVPFINSVATQLRSVQFGMNRSNVVMGTALFAFDDLIVEAASPAPAPPIVSPEQCQGNSFAVEWPLKPEIISYRVYENDVVLYEGVASRLTLNRSAGNFAYALQERDDCGWSGLSNSIKVLVRAGPKAPDTLYSSKPVVAPGQILTVTWDSIPGAASYELYESSLQIYAGQARSRDFSHMEQRDYLFTLKACNSCGCSPLSRTLTVTVGNPTDVTDGEQGAVPKAFALQQNYPNPFNPTTSIEYSVPIRTRVTIEIFNLLGNYVNTLLDDVKSPGTYRSEWDGTDVTKRAVSSGIYFYRLRIDDQVETKKMVLLK